MKWISIEDKIPSWGEVVFVYRGKLDVPDRWKFPEAPPTIGLSNSYENTITHWLPIPELPKLNDNK